MEDILELSEIVGIGNIFLETTSQRRVQIAGFIRDDLHGIGLGEILAEYLFSEVRKMGIAECCSRVYKRNTKANHLMKGLSKKYSGEKLQSEKTNIYVFTIENLPKHIPNRGEIVIR